MNSDSWTADWADMIALVGRDLSDGATVWGADRVEAGTIRRFLEPLEIGAAIHCDADTARAAGYADLVAPVSSLLSFTIPPMWSPGDAPLFDGADANAQPLRSPIDNPNRGPAPPTSGFFATDMSIDFLRPVVVGERLGLRGRRLLSCVPKETAVGRGAFSTTETEIVSDQGDVVAVMRTGTYAYNPFGPDEGRKPK
ncbi:FAS1-like dehydratase domain-containing protein [[Mycobacterium] vasticus]|uniref:MaoC family dehydratase N-terminal domain-containing protein n=1 Tax=[Mycobacterium] vasticus TaxID=2875777 RepID=A0ABU5YZF5_9MYCO|nr:MaoC family dehydratase N-terminal domain-containing protein [Mycolicibacter sp. MYC017]MEB3070280.1 MaoC family dehydratase N-terminal domain-containing protein [Mycolicibacter sp. MYC017]